MSVTRVLQVCSMLCLLHRSYCTFYWLCLRQDSDDQVLMLQTRAMIVFVFVYAKTS